MLIDNLGVRRSLILGSCLLLVSRLAAMLTTSIGLMYCVLFVVMPLGTALVATVGRAAMIVGSAATLSVGVNVKDLQGGSGSGLTSRQLTDLLTDLQLEAPELPSHQIVERLELLRIPQRAPLIRKCS